MNDGARFRILERDNFTCQYCGRKAPEVTLEVDHITPTSKGGKNIATNLITACMSCNRGKGAMEMKPIKEPEHIELPSGEGFKMFPIRNIRMSDKTWNELKKERSLSGLSWNKFILKKIEEHEEMDKQA